jgi:hypothetical protein
MEAGSREQPGVTGRLRRTVERFFQVYDPEAVEALLAEFRVRSAAAPGSSGRAIRPTPSS